MKERFFLYWFAVVVASWRLGGSAAEPPVLDLEQARDGALRNHPRITVAELAVLASQQVVRQARSGFLPQVSLNAVAVGTADQPTRLAANGGLNNPSVFDRQAEGLTISQLITDFGRTSNLSQSAKFRAQAEANNAQATREQILLQVDQAFYSALAAQAVAKVAQQTVTARQTLLDQIAALASHKLRSDLDVSFARVNLEDAKLLLSKAGNDVQAAYAQLANLMGEPNSKIPALSEPPMPGPLSTNAEDLVQQALQVRPDLLRLKNEEEAARKLARAERAARFPTVSAVGNAGVSPVHDPEIPDSYAAGGIVLNVPLYAGGLYAARQREAELRASAAEAQARDLENNVIRDVRIAWLNSLNAFERLRITQQLLENARESYSLAQARYQNGLSSMVELNQAELNAVSAEIAYANTQYEYLVQRSNLGYQTGALGLRSKGS